MVTRSIIAARIRRVSMGNFGDVRSIGDNIFELRIDYGPGFRVYYTQKEREVVILLCGGDKSTQNRDVETAKQIVKNLEEA